jgi:3-oxoacyl-[acyl-carrier-protein] synthase II
MHRRRVVITGLGVVSPVGTGVKAFWDGITSGKSGVRDIVSFDASPFRTRIAGECIDFDPKAISYADALRLDRVCQIALLASEEAVADSGLAEADEDSTGVFMGTGIGGINTIDQQQKALHQRGPRFVSPLTVPLSMFNAAAGHIAIRHKFRGPSSTISTACSSGSNAIGEAFRLIQHGYATTMLAGGTEAPVSYGIFSGWNALRVMSTRNETPSEAVRPFARDRDGLVLSEGAAVVVLEEYEHAKARGAKIYGEMIGYGYNNDGFHSTRPSVEGQMKAIRKALADAQINPEDIDYINAHGTATSANDSTETQAVKAALGDHAHKIPMSSIKSMLGHSMGASGALEFVASALTLRDGIVPPTVNYHDPDPVCDLDYVPNEARNVKVNTLLSNTFGFGGCNAILAVRKLNGA